MNQYKTQTEKPVVFGFWIHERICEEKIKEEGFELLFSESLFF